MNIIRIFLVPFAIIGAGAMALAPNAMARDQVNWSISVGTPGYYAPPPVIYRQPPVIYAPPQPVYVPRTVYPMVPPGVVYSGGPAYVYDYVPAGRPWHGRHWHRPHHR